VIISIILIVIVIAGLAYFGFISNRTVPPSTPVPLYSCNIVPLNPAVTNVPGFGTGAMDNVTQGTRLQVNLTFTSRTDQQLAISIENLMVTYYNSTVDYHRWVDTNNNYSLLQTKVFNYSLSLNPLTLQPDMSNSTILTINLAEDAPTGQYSLDIHLGNVIGASESYSETVGLEMIVTSK
jgi:hypothetical protein